MNIIKIHIPSIAVTTEEVKNLLNKYGFVYADRIKYCCLHIYNLRNKGYNIKSSYKKEDGRIRKIYVLE